MGRLFSRSDLSGLLDKPAKRHSARALAQAADLKCMVYLARFGHLTSADLARAVFSHAKYGQDMAARSLRRLAAPGVELAASRINSTGTRSWITTRRGVEWLQARGVVAHHGMDLRISGAGYFHYALCSRLLLEKEREGFNVWHEYAIAHGQAPLSQRQLIESYQKVPDGILIRGKQVYLLEIENAPKNLDPLAVACGAVLQVGCRLHPNSPLELAGLIFAFNAEHSGHAERIARAARKRWEKKSDAEQTELARHVQLVKIHLALPCVWLGYESELLAL